MLGTGALVGGEPFSIELTDALPASTANLIFGLSTVFAPFSGGVLVPNADIVILNLPTFAGEVTISGDWTTGLPAGLVTYYQYWIADAGGPSGFSASNAISGTVQAP